MMWKTLISIATFLSIVVGIIVQWPDIKAAFNSEQNDGDGKDKGTGEDKGTEENGQGGSTPPPPAPPEAACKRTFTVGSKPVMTRFTDAKVSGKDSEVDSDDWTSVDLSYDVITSSRDVKLELRWAVQERNSNQTRGNTRIESKKTFMLFDLNQEPGCAAYKIVATDIKSPSRGFEEFYRGSHTDRKNSPRRAI
jgi:hypothetical protein